MDDDEDPYESLPGKKNTTVYMLAGALSGTFEHCIMYPADVVRTRMQSLVDHRSFVKTVVQSISNEKFKLYRGMSAVIAGAGPAHALYFSAYENLKQSLLRTIANSNNSAETNNPKSVNRIIAHGISGCGATLIHDAVMNPFDVVKQRIQVYDSSFKTPRDCAKHILKNEGFKAFYRSYSTQLTMNLPYQSLHFITYEIMQDIFNKKREYNPFAHIISGGFAGGIAAACTTPLDVCKTLLNTQEKKALAAANCDRVTGLLDAARVVYRCRGLKGFVLGLPARVIVAAPSTATSWFVYEFFKNFIYMRRNVA